MQWSFAERDNVRLACRDFGGRGPSVLLVHGLAGHAGEWTETARWLTARCRVVAFDARGHGRSERAPIDVSRAAHVADTSPWSKSLDSPRSSWLVSPSVASQHCTLLPSTRTW